MAGVVPRLEQLLKEDGTEYATIHHHVDFKAIATAIDTHTPPEEFAKTVFLWIDGRYAMAVVPANKQVGLSKVRQALGAKEIRLASEDEVTRLCPDCEIGAAPPFGNLYDLPVYVSPALAADEEITFNAGSHDAAIRMAYADFERLVEPLEFPIAKYD